MSYYTNQSPQNPSYMPQGANPDYGWNPQPAPQAGGNYQSVPAFNDNPNYAENGVPKSNIGFDDRTIRAGFIRKVFSLVTVMLAVVAIITAIPFLHKPTMTFVQTSPGVYFLSYVTFLVVYIALICCESVRRSFPSNLICTAILTLSMGYMTAMISARYNIESVLMCLVITTVCCGGIIIFSMQTRYDLTQYIGIACILSLVLMVYGIVAIIGVSFFHVRWMYTVYAGLAALLFMFFLAFDIQSVMGGKKYEISPEDHIFAAIQIFLDIIYIFWFLLQIFGGSNNN